MLRQSGDGRLDQANNNAAVAPIATTAATSATMVMSCLVCTMTHKSPRIIWRSSTGASMVAPSVLYPVGIQK